MLKIIFGTAWVKNRDTILNMIAEDVMTAKAGRVVIVPELISHDYERRLCATAGDTATLYAEIISFTRMVRAVSEYAGKGTQPCLDKGGRLVAMASATRQLHSVLKSYASVETKPEFLTGLVSAIDEFKQSCVSSADLMTASKSSEGNLAQKLEELALIMDTYDGICNHGKRDPADLMNWLLEQLEDCDYAQQHTFYVDGFPDFTRQHMAILEHIILNSPNVTIGFNCDRPKSNDLVFECSGETLHHILNFAKKNGVEVELLCVEPDHDALCEIRERLFRGNTEENNALKPHLSVCRAESVYQECVAAARRVRKYISEGGRYRDVAVVSANPGSYNNTLILVFRRFNIPVYISGTENILDKPVINAFIAAVEAALGGFEQRDILNYLKSVICPLDSEVCDQLENYAVMWSIQGSMWTREWNMHPKGFGKDWKPYDTEYVAGLNKAKNQALAPLVRLQQAFRKATDLSGQVLAIYRFIEDISLVDTFEKLADLSDSMGDHRNAQIFSQLWEILLGALEQLHDILGKTVWDSETFARLLRLLLSQYDIGTIPPVLDAVMVGPVNAMRCQEEKMLIVIGADEGCLPAYPAASGVLSEQERNALLKMGIGLQGSAIDGLKSNFYDIYGVFCGARQNIYVSCGPGQPSFVHRRLAGLVGGAESIADTPAFSAGDRLDVCALLARDENEKAAKDLDVLDEYNSLISSAGYCVGTIQPETINSLYSKGLALSPTSVKQQANCRMAFFLKYGIYAKELKAITIDPAEFGTYVHDVLEKTGREVMDRGGFHTVTLDQTLQIAKEVSDKYVEEKFSAIESVRTNYLLQRNQDELFLIVEEFWKELNKSEFEPAAFELEFDNKKKYKAIPIDDAAIPASLNGKIDRIDRWSDGGNDYYRIVDYKTGREAIDYSDVLNGTGLQMLLYLFALEDMGVEELGNNPVPVGVSYFPARYEVLDFKSIPTADSSGNARAKAWYRSSLLLNDRRILEAISKEELLKFGVTLDKDGNITGMIASRDQFNQLKSFLKKTLKEMVNEIASGCVDPNPIYRGDRNNACKYCSFKTVCHPGENVEFRNMAATSFDLFWKKIEKEMEDHG